MLRISIIESPTRVSFVLEGSLIAPWLAELQEAWSRAQSKLRGRKPLIDIRSVTHISQQGEDALLSMMIEGAKINCNGVFNRRVVKELTRRCKANSKNVP